MNASVTLGWENFFVAEAGASAGLTGLLFVAVSINLSRILSIEYLPARAAETLVLLLSVLVTSTLGLIPRQSAHLLGTELIAAWGSIGLIITAIQVSSRKYKAVWNRLPARVLTHQLSLFPTLAAGLSLHGVCGGGLYWLAPGVLLTFATGIINAWVLLVEILR